MAKEALQRSARVTVGMTRDSEHFVAHSTYPLSMDSVRHADEGAFIRAVVEWFCGYAPWVRDLVIAFPDGEDVELVLDPDHDEAASG